VGRRCSYTDEQLEAAVKQSLSYAEVLSKVGLIPAGGNYSTLHTRIQALGLDTFHFRGKGWARGRRLRQRSWSMPLEAVLVEHSLYQSHKLKLRLIEAGVSHSCAPEVGTRNGASDRSHWSLITSTASGPTTGSRICGYCAPIATL
jgi:hypothetical protein